MEKGPVQVLLYAHWEDLLQSVPLNTMPPDPREPDLGRGFLMPTVKADTGICQGRTCVGADFGSPQFTFHLCTGTVTYEGNKRREDCFDSAFKGARVSHEQVILYWYMSVEAVPTKAAHDDSLGAMPQVGIYARLRNPEFMNGGTLLAESEPPRIGLEPRTTILAVPGSPNVYEFRVPMKIIKTTWNGYLPPGHAADSGHNVMLDVLVYQIHDGSRQVAQSDWRIRSGPKFPTRLIVPVIDPLEITAARVEVLKPSNVTARFSVFPTFGAYDADPASFRLNVTGPVTVSGDRIGAPRLRHPYDGHGPPKPLNVSYPVNLSGLPAGDYRMRFEATNLQGTFQVAAEASYRWEPPAAANVPAPFLAWIVAAMAAATVVRSRFMPPPREP